MWFDEVISMQASIHSFYNVITFNDPTPPFYNVLLWFWIKIFGISAIGVRLLGVAISTASIYVIYLLGNKFNKNAGVYAALILAVSPIHIWYAQEARAYILLFMMSLLSSYFYVSILQKFDKHNNKNVKDIRKYVSGKELFNKDVILYVICSALMIYTHLFGFLILLAHSIHYIIRKFSFKNFDYKKIANWIMIQAAILILYIPWIIMLPKILFTHNVSFSHIARPTIYSLVNFISEASFGKIFPIFWIILLAIYAYLIFKYIISRKDNLDSKFLIIWCLTPIIVTYIFSIIFTSIYMTRYIIMSFLPLIIIYGISLSKSKKVSRNILLALIVLVSISCIYIQQNTVTKDPWSDVNKYIAAYEVNNHRMQIGVMINYDAFSLAYYHNMQCLIDSSESDNMMYDCLRSKNVIAVKNINDIGYLNDSEIIIIISRSESINDLSNIMSSINSKYYVVDEKTFYAYDTKVWPELNIINSKNSFNKIRVMYMKRR